MLSLATVLKVAPWVLVALAIGWALWERADYYDCMAARAAYRAEA